MSILLWSLQIVHFCPWMSGLQTQRPVICSQSSLTEPNSEQPHATFKKKKLRLIIFQQTITTNASIIKNKCEPVNYATIKNNKKES